MKSPTGVVIVMMTLFTIACAIAEENKVFRDHEYGYSLHYPLSWNVFESTYKSTRIKIQNPTKDLECLVNVQRLQPNDTADPKTFATQSSANALAKATSLALPNAKIISAAPSTLSNQPAIELVMSYEYTTVGTVIPITSIFYSTVKKPYSYSVGCKSLLETDDAKIVQIYNIIGGFIIYPKKNLR